MFDNVIAFVNVNETMLMIFIIRLKFVPKIEANFRYPLLKSILNKEGLEYVAN